VIVVLAVDRTISPRFAAVLVLPVGYWILTSLSRAQYHEPAASRYLYPGAVFVILAVSELVPRLHVPGGRGGVIAAVAVLVLIVAVSLRGNVDQLRQGAAGLRDVSTYLKAELRAVELARGHVGAAFRPDPVRAPQIDAGGYLDAVRELGSPADLLADLRGQPGAVRNAADAVLVSALRVRLRPVGAVTSPVGGCILVTPDAHEDVPSRGPLVISTGAAPARVAARVLGDDFAPMGSVAENTDQKLSLVPISAGPWHVRVDSSAPVRVCRAG
jgi:hypothetical protein